VLLFLKQRKNHFIPTYAKSAKKDVTEPKTTPITSKGRFQQSFASLMTYFEQFV